MPRALVTGGAGFIGSHLVAHLVEDLGWPVTVLDDLSGGSRDRVHPRARFVHGSLQSPAAIDEAFEGPPPELIYHLAAFASEGMSDLVKRHCYESNVIGSVALLNAALRARVERFVFVSSAAVYGEGPTPMRETQALRPRCSFGLSKMLIELELERCAERFGLDHAILRLHNVFGVGQRLDDPSRNVIGIFMNQLLGGQPLTIYGDGEQQRQFTHISEVLPQLAAAGTLAAARNQTINLGADRTLSVNALADSVMVAMGRRSPVVHLPPRPEAARVQVDHSKGRAIFGSPRSMEFKRGLDEMAAWAALRGFQEPRAGLELELPARLVSDACGSRRPPPGR